MCYKVLVNCSFKQFYGRKYDMDMSVNEIELTVRSANILNNCGITTVRTLVERCVILDTFVGIKGYRGAGVAVNFEIAQKLYNLGFLKSLEGIRKPMTQFPRLSLKDLFVLSEKSAVNFDTKLTDLDWTWEEKCLHLCDIEDEGGSWVSFCPPHSGKYLCISDLVRHWLRVDDSGDYVFRTWGFRMKSEKLEKQLAFNRKKLAEWDVKYKYKYF